MVQVDNSDKKVPRKILFLVAHRPGRSPGQRFRFEQYLDYLHQNGFECTISYLIDQHDDEVFYAKGKYVSKGLFVLKSIRQRIQDLKRAKEFDIIFLYREAHMLGSTWFEEKLHKMGLKMVVDFDDSIWLKDISNGNQNLAFLKRPSKTHKIVALCDTCIVGNQYLADYAKQFNKNVYVIPTTINTDHYQFAKRSEEKSNIVIGWTGSSTTIKHFSIAVPFLKIIREKYGRKVTFRVISDEPYTGELEGLENIKWNRENEVSDLDVIDIGIMPLPDDPWSRGKCGFKGLQYMALKKPAVMSPVGVNKDIIEHGRNGFLASATEEWVKILSMLIENEEIRKTIGEQGRKTVEERFSYNSQKDNYLNIFKQLANHNE
jgi:glycosyltransferase involved in cell wall biosynthesis